MKAEVIGRVKEGILDSDLEGILSEISFKNDFDSDEKGIGIESIEDDLYYVLRVVPFDGVYHFANFDDVEYFLENFNLGYTIPPRVEWDYYVENKELQDNIDDYIMELTERGYPIYLKISMVGKKRILCLWHPDIEALGLV